MLLVRCEYIQLVRRFVDQIAFAVDEELATATGGCFCFDFRCPVRCVFVVIVIVVVGVNCDLTEVAEGVFYEEIIDVAG